MVIATWPESECVSPPIGSLGVIAEAIDSDGDYFVTVDGYPCPIGDEPEWFIPSWALVPIDSHEGTESQYQSRKYPLAHCHT